MDLSILELYILSLLDRGLLTKYDLQRQGGVSLGSSTPALKRMQDAGLVTAREADDDTLRARHVLKLTSAGRRIAPQHWRNHFSQDANLDLEAILRLIDIARHQGAAKKEIAGFLNAMAAKRAETPTHDQGGSVDGVVNLQRRWSAQRAKAEAKFLADVASSYRRPKPVGRTKRAGIKVRQHR